VEDNKMNQMIVTRFLEKEDIHADVVDNGLKAIEFLKNNTYDIVLMDLQMPEMDGFETSEYIRKKLKITDLPIVAFTASSSSDIENKVLEAGMNDYIVKPFEPSSFYSIIAKHTGREGSKGPINPEPMSTSRKLTDLTYLKDASSGNQTFINEMIDIFLKQTPLYLEQLFQFCENKDWTEFRKVMHKLKPTITMMGIKEGEELVKQIEKKVKGLTDLHAVKPSLEELNEICEGSFLELKGEIIR
jgi:CheY-like chemotaxis protein/HPt (histidine-containing phosphotransfer) domain-containing protein